MKRIYFGGDLITMEAVSDQEAVYVEDGVIRGVGSRELMEVLAGPSAERVDLRGRTMMPAFIDSLGHLGGGQDSGREKEDLGQRLSRLDKVQRLYLSSGIATAQEGEAQSGQWELLHAAAERGRLKLDTVCCLDMNLNQELLRKNRAFLGRYHNRLKIGGYQLTLDSSSGGLRYGDERVETLLETCIRERVQVIAQCNGEEAADQLIKCFERALTGTGVEIGAIHPVLAGGKYLRVDQLEIMARLQIMVSFPIANTYEEGDEILRDFGKHRCAAVYPVQTALGEGVSVTFHQSPGWTSPDLIRVVWSAVNRLSRDGQVVGEVQRVSVREALKAVTISAARQYREDNIKGSIREGKIADLLVLSDNPFKLPPEELDRIKVLAVIKDGEAVYSKS